MQKTLTDGVSLLTRALGYALGGVAAVEPALLTRPTPCADRLVGFLGRQPDG
jgi:hypothetical protein